MQKISEIIAKVNSSQGDVEFLKTGFPTLDRQLDGGFLRKELIVLGGFTGLGKSYVAGQILYNIAKTGKKCMYFSLEISSETFVNRLTGALSNIKPTRIKAGFLKPDEHMAKLKAQKELITYDDKILLFDDLYLLEEIVDRIVSQTPDFVVIDFVQNVFSKGSDEYQRLSKIALDLQKLAKQQNCCIMVLSQLSNVAAREGSKSPIVEYKGSGNIATACDLGFFLERDQYIEGSYTQTVKLCLRKNRRGFAGLYFPLIFKHPGGYIYEQPTEYYGGQNQIDEPDI